jgi:hypothetical protein
MATRTAEAIALRPTGNYFLGLTTGQYLNRNRWTALPVPADIIYWVLHTFARRSGATQGLTFKDRSGIPYVDPDDVNSNDESYNPTDDSVASNDYDDHNSLPDDDVDDAPIEGVNNDIDDNNDDNNRMEPVSEEDIDKNQLIVERKIQTMMSMGKLISYLTSQYPTSR